MSAMLRRIAATTWARSLEFLRDRSSLGWNLVFPILMVAGLAFVFSGPGQPLFKVAVVGAEGRPLDTTLHPFLGTPQVQFYREASVAAALPKVQRHRVDLLLDFGTTPPRAWRNGLSTKGELLQRLIAGSGGAALTPALTEGAPIRYVDWVAPGVLGMNMMYACLFGIGYVIVRYRKNGYLKRLNATPLRPVEFLLAQLLSRLALILVVNAFVFVACWLLLDLRMEGAWLDLAVVVALGAFAMIAMGLVVAARIASEELAGGILNVVSTPMLVMCGVFFAMDGAPKAVLLAADLLPLTHLLVAARAIMLDGADLASQHYPLGALALMSGVYLTIGALLFRWRQD